MNDINELIKRDVMAEFDAMVSKDAEISVGEYQKLKRYFLAASAATAEAIALHIGNMQKVKE